MVFGFGRLKLNADLMKLVLLMTIMLICSTNPKTYFYTPHGPNIVASEIISEEFPMLIVTEAYSSWFDDHLLDITMDTVKEYATYQTMCTFMIVSILDVWFIATIRGLILRDNYFV